VAGAVFKTVREAVRAVSGGFDSHSPPPKKIRDFGFWIGGILENAKLKMQKAFKQSPKINFQFSIKIEQADSDFDRLTLM
jgi:hypothetical protein